MDILCTDRDTRDMKIKKPRNMNASVVRNRLNNTAAALARPGAGGAARSALYCKASFLFGPFLLLRTPRPYKQQIDLFKARKAWEPAQRPHIAAPRPLKVVPRGARNMFLIF